MTDHGNTTPLHKSAVVAEAGQSAGLSAPLSASVSSFLFVPMWTPEDRLAAVAAEAALANKIFNVDTSENSAIRGLVASRVKQAATEIAGLGERGRS